VKKNSRWAKKNSRWAKKIPAGQKRLKGVKTTHQKTSFPQNSIFSVTEISVVFENFHGRAEENWQSRVILSTSLPS
jgi:hypothetical protein